MRVVLPKGRESAPRTVWLFVCPPPTHPPTHCSLNHTVHTAAQRVTLFIVTVSPAPCPAARKRQITETLSVHSRRGAVEQVEQERHTGLFLGLRETNTGDWVRPGQGHLCDIYSVTLGRAGPLLSRNRPPWGSA